MDELRQIGLDFSVASTEVIDALISDYDDASIFDDIIQANKNRPEILRFIYDHENTPDKAREAVARLLSLPVTVSRELVEKRQKELEKSREARTESLVHKVQKLGVSDRVRLAMRGSREIRNILIKDTNKEVVLSVLENPKLTETEIEMIARSRNVPDEALRTIARNREWMKSYAVLFALVTNPKTPPGIAMGFISSLKPKDLGLLEKNKNVAEAIRSAAKRLTSSKKK